MNSDGNDSLDAMSLEFVTEIKDDLASLEPDLLIMEEKGANVDDELINHAFRSIHSIKGGAGFIDFKELSSLSHALENVLMRVREKKLIITSKIVDALLSGFDKMKLLVDLMGTDEVCDCEAEKVVLEQILMLEANLPETKEIAETKKEKDPKFRAADGQIQTGDASEEKQNALTEKPALQAVKSIGDSVVFQDKVFYIDKNRLENALDCQKFVYAVYISFNENPAKRLKDVDSTIDDIKSIGDLLFSDLERQAKGKNNPGFFCVISTILDLPLLAQVLEMNTIQMALVDKQFIDPETILKGFSTKPGIDGLKESSNLPGLSPSKADEDLPNVSEPKLFAPSNTQTIRINVDLVSKLMNRAGELVLSRNQLRPVMEKYTRENSNAANMMQNLDMVTTDIQEAIMQMRMQPMADLMGKYKRVVRDIARRMSKKVDFVLEGGDVEVDRNVLEKLANPVTHLIRNSIDHGIETPEERQKRFKPETGTIRIKAFHQGGHVHLIISDDGAGIDPQLVLSKAFEKGLVSEDQIEGFTAREKIDLIFLPGFSTTDTISDISGRGVGMDVVKTNIERLRGQIEIDSTKGEGTRIRLIIPLTLAIVPSLIVSSGNARFAIPQANIKEVLYLEPGEIFQQVKNIAGSEVLRLRDQLLPVLRLRNVLGIKTYIQHPGTGKKEEEKRTAIADRRQKTNGADTLEKRMSKPDRRQAQWDTTYVIILKLGGNVFGLCVDELFDIEEVVVESLPEYIKHLKCFSGTTILGDGDVIMILDVPGIASFACLKFDTIKNEEIKQKQLKEKENQKKGEKRDLIVFGHGKKEYFALELKSIARLEPVKPSDIHCTGSLKYVEYNGHAVLLFSMDEFLPASAHELNNKEMFAIFPKHVSARVGIIASKIIDTIETDAKLTRDAACPESILGKLFIKDMMVQVLDPEKFVGLIQRKAIIAKDPVEDGL